MAVARRLGARSTRPISTVEATGTIGSCLCRLFFCSHKLAGRSRHGSARDSHDRGATAWNVFVKPAHPFFFLHMLPFERLCRIGDTAVAAVI